MKEVSRKKMYYNMLYLYSLCSVIKKKTADTKRMERERIDKDDGQAKANYYHHQPHIYWLVSTIGIHGPTTTLYCSKLLDKYQIFPHSHSSLLFQPPSPPF